MKFRISANIDLAVYPLDSPKGYLTRKFNEALVNSKEEICREVDIDDKTHIDGELHTTLTKIVRKHLDMFIANNELQIISDIDIDFILE